MFLRIHDLLERYRLRRLMPLAVLTVFAWHVGFMHFYAVCGGCSPVAESSACCHDCDTALDSITFDTDPHPGDHDPAACDCKATVAALNSNHAQNCPCCDDADAVDAPPLWAFAPAWNSPEHHSGHVQSSDPPREPDRSFSSVHLKLLSGIQLRL